MDIKRKQVTNRSQWASISIGALIVLSLLLMLRLFFSPTSDKVPFHDLRLGTAQRGDLVTQIESFGTLQSREQRLITAEVDATVSIIHLKAGALLQPGDKIAQFTNPELQLTLQNQQRKLDQAKSTQEQTRLNQEREIFQFQSALAGLQADHEAAELKRQAESRLAQKGIVSRLELKRTQLDVKQLSRRLSLEHQQINHLRRIHSQALTIQQNAVEQAQGELLLWQARQEKLTVIANQAGILQQMPLELGQTVRIGDQLALIGSIHALIAQIDVPQSLVRRVKPSQSVQVRIGHQAITGEIIRIAPEVIDGMVTVDVALPDELPPQARPAMNIAATIATGTLNNTLYIERPLNSRANSQTELFVYSDKDKEAVRRTVSLGENAGKYIQVLSGLKPQEQVVLSDTTPWQQKNAISVSL